MNNFRYIFFVFLYMILITSCENQKFENEDDFKTWLAGKHFESTSKDFDQLDIHGNLHSPVGTLELKFTKRSVIYNDCSPSSYKIYQANEGWIVSFYKCGSEDEFELVVPEAGNCYMRSDDYDTSHMEESSSSAIGRLDAMASKQVVKGPDMEIK